MKTFKIGQLENGQFFCWYTGNTIKGLKEFLQYIVNSLNSADSFIVVVPEENKAIKAIELAEHFFKIKKQTFAEKLEEYHE